MPTTQRAELAFSQCCGVSSFVYKYFKGFVSSFQPCFHSYISKVGVLKILVKANYKYIPSLDDILETSAVTCLRNQLLEAEHYQLAVEVCCFYC